MSILTWIEDKKRLKVLNAPQYVSSSADSNKGLWTRCDKCGVILYIKHLKENQRVCFGCSYHLQMMSQERIENLLDKVPAIASPSSSGKGLQTKSGPTSSYPFGRIKDLGARQSTQVKQRGKFMVSTWRPLDETVSPCDPLRFHDQKNYTDRLKDAQERTGLQDAIQTGTGMIDGIPVALAVMDFSFMGGSMGSVVGEKITRLIEYATQEGLTLLIVSASGGARMQEGVFSLMQMAKISSSLQIYQSCAKLLYISILTSPTTGGVTASFAMLGDIIFAEPKALIAFAGRRVIEQTLAEDLPEDFQTSESMLHHGLVDLIVPRRFLRQALSETIKLYQNAPFKKIGIVPFGVQNPITFLTEEKVRRQWGTLTKPGTKEISEDLQSKISCPSLLGSKAAKFCVAKPIRGTALSEDRNLKELHNAQNGGWQSQKEFQTNLFGAKDFQNNLESNLKGELASQSRVYRDILRSFEMMLNLFASGKMRNESSSFSVLDHENSRGVRFTQSSLLSSRAAKFCVAKPCLGVYRRYTAKRANLAQNNLRKFGMPYTVGARGYTAKQFKSFDNNKTAIEPVNLNNTNFSQNGDHQKIEMGNGTSSIDRTQEIVFRVPNGEFRKSRSYNQVLAVPQRGNKGHKPRVQSNQNSEKNRVVFKSVQTGQYKKLEKALYQNNLQQIKNLRNENEIVPFDKNNMFSNFLPAWFHKKTDRSLLLHNFRFFSESFLSKDFKESRQGFNSNSSSERLHIPKKQLLGFFANKNENVSPNVTKFAGLGGLQSGSLYATGPSGQNADINFLNQAIELAATDSLEWRCFYIHQQLEGKDGFLEDFLQQDHDSKRKNGNLLFYKSICRSEKTVGEQFP